jgi:hypothetical protein
MYINGYYDLKADFATKWQVKDRWRRFSFMMLTSPHEEIVMKGNSFPIFLRSEWLITA